MKSLPLDPQVKAILSQIIRGDGVDPDSGGNYINSSIFDPRWTLDAKNRDSPKISHSIAKGDRIDHTLILGNYEARLLDSILVSTKPLVVVRAGAGSGKSTTIKYLSKNYGSSETESDSFCPSMISVDFDPFLPKFSFDSEVEDKEKLADELKLELSIQIYEELKSKLRARIRSLLEKQKILTDEGQLVDFILLNSIYEHLRKGFGIGLNSDVSDDLVRVFTEGNLEYTREALNEFCIDRREIKTISGIAIRDAVNKFKSASKRYSPSVKLALAVQYVISMSAMYRQRSDSQGAKPVVLAFDNSDKLNVDISSAVFEQLMMLQPKTEHVVLVGFLRVTTMRDVIGQNENAEIIDHYTLPPSHMVMEKLIKFLGDTEKVLSGQTSRVKEDVISRAFLLVLGLVDKEQYLQNTIDSMAGTNHKIGNILALKWLCELDLSARDAQDISQFSSRSYIGLQWKRKIAILQIADYLLLDLHNNIRTHEDSDGLIDLNSLISKNYLSVVTILYNHDVLGDLGVYGGSSAGNEQFIKNELFYNLFGELSVSDFGKKMESAEIFSGSAYISLLIRHKTNLRSIADLNIKGMLENSGKKMGSSRVASNREITNFFIMTLFGLAGSMDGSLDSAGKSKSFPTADRSFNISILHSFPILNRITTDFKRVLAGRKTIPSRYRTSVLMLGSAGDSIESEDRYPYSAFNFLGHSNVYHNCLSLLVIHVLCEHIDTRFSGNSDGFQQMTVGDVVNRFKQLIPIESAVSFQDIMREFVSIERRMVISGTADDYNIASSKVDWDSYEKTRKRNITATWSGFGYYNFQLRSSHYLRWCAVNSNNSSVREFLREQRQSKLRISSVERSVGLYVKILMEHFNATRDIRLDIEFNMRVPNVFSSIFFLSLNSFVVEMDRAGPLNSFRSTLLDIRSLGLNIVDWYQDIRHELDEGVRRTWDDSWSHFLKCLEENKID